MRDEITWHAAAELPLCLLTRNMLNRQIIDSAFKAANAEPNFIMETNAFTVALVQVINGAAATIAPELLVESIPLAADIRSLTLIEPRIEKPIGVVVSEREPVLPAVDALLSSLKGAAR